MTDSGERADPIRELRIGAHSLRIEPPDLYLITFSGAFSGEEALELARELDGFAQGKPYILGIGDTTDIGTVAPGARRALLEFTPLIRGSATLGVSSAMRLVLSLMHRAYRMIHRGTDHPIVFVADEEAARAWISERRKELDAAAEQKAL